MAENVHDVAALILSRLGMMDTWRLQKLTYYAQAWHLVRHRVNLFDDEIQAWANGPVVPNLYDRSRGRFSVDTWPSGDPSRLGPEALRTIEWVLQQYGAFSGGDLSRITHAEAPWRLARAGLPDGARSEEPIDPRTMVKYYTRLRLSPDEAVSAAVGSARLEGYTFSDEDKDRLRQVASGERTADDAVAEILARYRRHNPDP
ncbi:type II toxin-antitoxin system antitoxin SocA domain-containing protein [Parafrankia elaeagni]|uniref:type II toxin-antitoxin system antitoxin SocA domain-containing protein n=1 Tax=Parafrankia elaeagni TaxID=222534 RepID=UPI00036C89B8|nr:type II toxin-antitoxin system antitoxin SocA domain-containing protein [Parafrankia elaeagni]